MSLFSVIGLLILAAVVSGVIWKAPSIIEPYKGYILWFIWACVVLYLAWIFFGPFPDVRIPRRRG